MNEQTNILSVDALRPPPYMHHVHGLKSAKIHVCLTDMHVCIYCIHVAPNFHSQK